MAAPPVIRPIEPDEIEAARHLLMANHWGPRVEDGAVFAQVVAQSQIALVAVADGRVVGFLRAITDGLFNGYLSMLVVDEAWRRQGIGSALVQAAMGRRDGMTWVLRAAREPGVTRFYETLGFTVSTVAMERTRR